MKKVFSIVIAAVLLLSFCTIGFAGQTSGELKFDENGEFRILHITDPQDDAYMAYELPKFLKKAIEETNPDLIVFTGDIVEDKRGADKDVDGEDTREGVCVYDEDGEIIYDKTIVNVKKATENVFSIINSYGIPFAVAQGNNDYKCDVSNEEWLEIYSEYENCLTKDESEGFDRIDYHLEIKGNDGETAFNIYMMDTGSKKVTDDSIKWYKKQSNALKEANGGEAVPSFVFQHIYVNEIGNLFEICNIWDDGVIMKDGLACRLDRSVARGHFTEITETPYGTSKEFKAWLKQGDVIGAFFGHEHYGGYTGTYKGIELGLTYGCEFAKSGPYGYRVITLYEDDIENYDNDVYYYTCSTSKEANDGYFTLEEDESYPTYDSLSEKFSHYVENFKTNFVLWLESIFD